MSEAQQGCVPVRRSIMRRMQAAADPANAARLAMLEKVINDHILVPQSLHVIRRSKKYFGEQCSGQSSVSSQSMRH